MQIMASYVEIGEGGDWDADIAKIFSFGKKLWRNCCNFLLFFLWSGDILRLRRCIISLSFCTLHFYVRLQLGELLLFVKKM